MDQVKLTRLQLRTLNDADENVIVTATNEDSGQIYVCREKYPDKGKWLLPTGKYRKSPTPD